MIKRIFHAGGRSRGWEGSGRGKPSSVLISLIKWAPWVCPQWSPVPTCSQLCQELKRGDVCPLWQDTNPVNLFPGSLTLVLKTHSVSPSSVCLHGEQSCGSPGPTHTAHLSSCFSSASHCCIGSLRYFSKALSLMLSLLLHQFQKC